jgi:hypothetical protein
MRACDGPCVWGEGVDFLQASRALGLKEKVKWQGKAERTERDVQEQKMLTRRQRRDIGMSGGNVRDTENRNQKTRHAKDGQRDGHKEKQADISSGRIRKSGARGVCEKKN